MSCEICVAQIQRRKDDLEHADFYGSNPALRSRSCLVQIRNLSSSKYLEMEIGIDDLFDDLWVCCKPSLWNSSNALRAWRVIFGNYIALIDRECSWSLGNGLPRED